MLFVVENQRTFRKFLNQASQYLLAMPQSLTLLHFLLSGKLVMSQEARTAGGNWGRTYFVLGNVTIFDPERVGMTFL